jgi:hypothetical protein
MKLNKQTIIIAISTLIFNLFCLNKQIIAQNNNNTNNIYQEKEYIITISIKYSPSIQDTIIDYQIRKDITILFHKNINKQNTILFNSNINSLEINN